MNTIPETLAVLKLFKPHIQQREVFTWDSQKVQYPPFGPPGVNYFRGDFPTGHRYSGLWVDCLLSRSEQGILQGVLNYYSFDLPPFEQRGTVNLFIDPKHKRQGIATALLDEAFLRFSINLLQQRYSPSGLAFIIAYLERKIP